MIAKALPHPGKSQTYGSVDDWYEILDVVGRRLTLLSVTAHVLLEGCRLGEALVAYLTLERAVTRV